MYNTDSSDVMLPNAPEGINTAGATWCGNETESWGASDANTNVNYYETSILAPYMGNQVGVYACPGDTLPSANGHRIRSYSMNSQMGNIYQNVAQLTAGFNPGYVVFSKMSQLTGATLSPSDAFVFCEENMCSLDDGYFQVSSGSPIYPNVPGSYHRKVAGFSFADGHVEAHRWMTADLPGFVTKYYATKQTATDLADTGAKNNVDWLWLTSHATCPNSN